MLAAFVAHGAYTALQPDPRLVKLTEQARRAHPGRLEQAKYLTGWIYTSLDTSTSMHDPSAVFDRMGGSCGARDVLFRAAAAELGLKARRVNFLHVPIQRNHSATEILIGGQWRFLDSTFGLYFARPGAPDTPLSIHAARHLYPHVLVLQVNATAYTGRWGHAAGYPYRTIQPGLVTHRGRPLADVERTYFVSEMRTVKL